MLAWFGEDLYLPHDRAFEYNKHEEREERVIPILVQTPQSHAKDLEDEEWRDGMLLKEFLEPGDWDIEAVESVVLFCVL